MKTTLRIIFIILAMSLTGCKTPQWRIFQAKVPDPIVKQDVQIEAERAAADLVARIITAPAEAIPVAQKLSESLGVPESPIVQTKPTKARDEALEGLREGMQQQQQDLSDLNERLAKYDGKKIEGTGVNMFGFAVSLPVLGLIALAIFCPSAIGVMWWIIKKTKGALVATIKGVQDFKDDNPTAVESLNSALASTQDAAHKSLIKKLKLNL